MSDPPINEVFCEMLRDKAGADHAYQILNAQCVECGKRVMAFMLAWRARTRSVETLELVCDACAAAR